MKHGGGQRGHPKIPQQGDGQKRLERETVGERRDEETEREKDKDSPYETETEADKKMKPFEHENDDLCLLIFNLARLRQNEVLKNFKAR